MSLGDSVGGLLGIGGSGQQISAGGNQGLTQMNAQNALYNDNGAMNELNQYGMGNVSGDELASKASGYVGPEEQQFMNAAATGPSSGSQYAANQMAGNATQEGLYGPQGQLGNTENLINQEQNQGFNLTQGDNTLYGQEAGQIANQFGQQGNQASQDLANRGLSSSGAAGATFQGIAGNQNQMLANAQQQIAQTRFTNTQNQIAQNQNYASQLGNQYNSALQQQYSRQLSGAQNEEGLFGQAAGTESGQQQLNLEATGATNQAAPQNAVDLAGGVLAGMGAKATGNSLFGAQNVAGAAPSKTAGAASQVAET